LRQEPRAAGRWGRGASLLQARRPGRGRARRLPHLRGRVERRCVEHRQQRTRAQPACDVRAPLRYRWSATVCIAHSMGALLSFFLYIYIFIFMYICTCSVATSTRGYTRAHARDVTPGLRRCTHTTAHHTVCGREQALHPLHRPQYTICRPSLCAWPIYFL
jgi:hypothetical protein